MVQKTKAIKLYDYQKDAVENLKTGSILCGGVGSGKSLTAIAYYFVKECGGSIDPFSQMLRPVDLYIITTARKRDTLEWDQECSNFFISKYRPDSINTVKLTIDSWNNLHKYVDITNAFFIFDEQRVVGSGSWVKSFLKITKLNRWILLTATPGDTWMDYIPVFIANGYYKNRTDFLRQHVIFNTFVKFPKVDRYVGTHRLIELRKKVLVNMDYSRKTVYHNKYIKVQYDEGLYNILTTKRWDVYEDKPIKNISKLCYLWRKVTNSHPSRAHAVVDILQKNNRAIVFYNFDYELEILRQLGEDFEIPYSEWNGHRHESIPTTSAWMYLVQYTSGAEGWNCIETNTVIFYSQNYAYKTMHQAAGRIDRLNTPFKDLYYYHLVSSSPIDIGISRALANKQHFNESRWSTLFA